jgi:Protein of unknown function (DUF1549)/Protein of unknown function (DUF1553)
MKPFLLFIFSIILISTTPCQSDAGESQLNVYPEKVVINGRYSNKQLIVTLLNNSKKSDLTHICEYRSLDPSIVSVSKSGQLTPLKTGNTFVEIRSQKLSKKILINVIFSDGKTEIDFKEHIVPIFTRNSCNSGPCHGKARGQNGFQLSLFGYDHEFDYNSVSKQSRSRRISIHEPEESLLLKKATGDVPHGGGIRLKKEDRNYRLLLKWIEEGLPALVPDTPTLVGLEVYPPARIMGKKEKQQVAVTAKFSDGSSLDVTQICSYQSNEAPIASVNENGLISAGKIVGEAAIMCRFQGFFTTCHVSVPMGGKVPESIYAKLPRYNFIDSLVYEKMKPLGFVPSEVAQPYQLMRRAYIDIIGRIPTSKEARSFLKNSAPNKYSQLVDDLLERPEFAEHWATKWIDLLRPNPYRVGIKAVLNYDFWIRDSFRKNKPYDQFVRELITAQGSTFKNGAVTMYRDRRTPEELTTITSQLFLGIRLECAKCHHHPFEIWGQDDFYSFAAFFSNVSRKGGGLSPPISGSEELVYSGNRRKVLHPVTKEVMNPRPLFGKAEKVEAGSDSRQILANWMTSPENPFFSQVMANRIWADLLGRGIVHPVDDLRGTNPPTNKKLLEALGKDFSDHQFDIKHLIRRIANSYIYQLDSLPNKRNIVDNRYFSRYYRQRLKAEVLLDSITQITGIPESFDAMPPETRSNEIWTHRVGSLFLDAFGRPDPNQDPPCERNLDTTVVQALHLMNSENLYKKITQDKAIANQLSQSTKSSEAIIEEIYLMVYSRFPTSAEINNLKILFEVKNASRKEIIEDIFWSTMNTPEFVFKD